MRVFETSGRSRLLGSGTERDTAEAAIVAALGPPSGPDTLNDDCGLTIVGWAPGFTVLFDGDVLAGWSAYAAGAPRTAAGLGIGSTRADLDAAYTASVASSTLSTEFAAGGIAGLLDGTEPDAAITNLWAGNACIAR